jgi:hypothetical protein
MTISTIHLREVVGGLERARIDRTPFLKSGLFYMSTIRLWTTEVHGRN